MTQTLSFLKTHKYAILTMLAMVLAVFAGAPDAGAQIFDPGRDLPEAIGTAGGGRSLREVILLADIEELSYREISATINVPMGTIASRLYRGHNLLKEKLQEYARKSGYK